MRDLEIIHSLVCKIETIIHTYLVGLKWVKLADSTQYIVTVRSTAAPLTMLTFPTRQWYRLRLIKANMYHCHNKQSI